MKLKTFKETEFVAFEQFLTTSTQKIEQARVAEAMHYSLMNGGKRVRPLLLLATLKALHQSVEQGWQCALALEYIHTYSLIHDDLPAMDNDDYRRGQLTSHKQFDEATAILAGDALLTQAFHWELDTLDPALALDLIKQLASAAGANGMIGGQMDDILAEERQIPLDELVFIHRRKTGALIRYAVYAACRLANVSNEVTSNLSAFADSFGLAFQIHNDIQDKAQDEKLQKSTYVSLLGQEKAKMMLQKELTSAKKALEQAQSSMPDLDSELLLDFLDYLA